MIQITPDMQELIDKGMEFPDLRKWASNNVQRVQNGIAADYYSEELHRIKGDVAYGLAITKETGIIAYDEAAQVAIRNLYAKYPGRESELNEILGEFSYKVFPYSSDIKLNTVFLRLITENNFKTKVIPTLILREGQNINFLKEMPEEELYQRASVLCEYMKGYIGLKDAPIAFSYIEHENKDILNDLIKNGKNLSMKNAVMFAYASNIFVDNEKIMAIEKSLPQLFSDDAFPFENNNFYHIKDFAKYIERVNLEEFEFLGKLNWITPDAYKNPYSFEDELRDLDKILQNLFPNTNINELNDEQMRILETICLGDDAQRKAFATIEWEKSIGETDLETLSQAIKAGWVPTKNSSNIQFFNEVMANIFPNASFSNLNKDELNLLKAIGNCTRTAQFATIDRSEVIDDDRISKTGIPELNQYKLCDIVGRYQLSSYHNDGDIRFFVATGFEPNGLRGELSDEETFDIVCSDRFKNLLFAQEHNATQPYAISEKALFNIFEALDIMNNDSNYQKLLTLRDNYPYGYKGMTEQIENRLSDYQKESKEYRATLIKGAVDFVPLFNIIEHYIEHYTQSAKDPDYNLRDDREIEGSELMKHLGNVLLECRSALKHNPDEYFLKNHIFSREFLDRLFYAYSNGDIEGLQDLSSQDIIQHISNIHSKDPSAQFLHGDDYPISVIADFINVSKQVGKDAVLQYSYPFYQRARENINNGIKQPALFNKDVMNEIMSHFKSDDYPLSATAALMYDLAIKTNAFEKGLPLDEKLDDFLNWATSKDNSDTGVLENKIDIFLGGGPKIESVALQRDVASSYCHDEDAANINWDTWSSLVKYAETKDPLVRREVCEHYAYNALEQLGILKKSDPPKELLNVAKQLAGCEQITTACEIYLDTGTIIRDNVLLDYMDYNDTLIRDNSGRIMLNNEVWGQLSRDPIWDYPNGKVDLYKACCALGAFGDNKEISEKAIKYLKNLSVMPSKGNITILDKQKDGEALKKAFPALKLTKIDDLTTMSVLMRADGSLAYQQDVDNVNELLEKYHISNIESFTLVPQLSAEDIEDIEDPLIKAFTKELGDTVYRDVNYETQYRYEVDQEALKQMTKSEKNAMLKRYFNSEPTELQTLKTEFTHNTFSGLKLEYNQGFADYIMLKTPEILKDNKKQSLVASIQSNWASIEQSIEMDKRGLDDDRNVPLNRVIDFMSDNKYPQYANMGEEYHDFLKYCSMYNYSSLDVEELMSIYDSQKTRDKNAIPAIEGSFGEYTYQMLPLNDPAGLFFGRFLGCCQCFDDQAHDCMVNSCTSDNSRVFIVRNADDKIVAGSWVWRNGQTICFDNVETVRRDNVGKRVIPTALIGCYKQAAKDLIEATKGEKINDKAFGASRITVGNGCSDMNLKGLDKSEIAPFPIEKDSIGYLYDSRTQFILQMDKELEEIYKKADFTKDKAAELAKNEDPETLRSLVQFEETDKGLDAEEQDFDEEYDYYEDYEDGIAPEDELKLNIVVDDDMTVETWKEETGQLLATGHQEALKELSEESYADIAKQFERDHRITPVDTTITVPIPESKEIPAPVDFETKNRVFIEKAMQLDAEDKDTKLVLIMEESEHIAPEKYALVAMINTKEGYVEDVIPLPIFDRLAGGAMNFSMEEFECHRKYGKECLPDLQKLDFNAIETLPPNTHMPHFAECLDNFRILEKCTSNFLHSDISICLPTIVKFEDKEMIVLLNSEKGTPFTPYHQPHEVYMCDYQIFKDLMNDKNRDISKLDEKAVNVTLASCNGKSLERFIREDFDLLNPDLKIIREEEPDIVKEQDVKSDEEFDIFDIMDAQNAEPTTTEPATLNNEELAGEESPSHEPADASHVDE